MFKGMTQIKSIVLRLSPRTKNEKTMPVVFLQSRYCFSILLKPSFFYLFDYVFPEDALASDFPVMFAIKFELVLCMPSSWWIPFDPYPAEQGEADGNAKVSSFVRQGYYRLVPGDASDFFQGRKKL